MNQTWLRMRVIWGVAAALCGCVLYEPYISDLSLASIEVVPARVLIDGKLRDDGPQMKIIFSSEVDLVDIAQGEHFFPFPVRRKTALCKNRALDRREEY